jgi:hypothetical protein
MVLVVECAAMGLAVSAARCTGTHLLVQGTNGHIHGMATQGRMEAEEAGGAMIYVGEAMAECIGNLIFGQGMAISGSDRYRQGIWGRTCMEDRVIKVIKGSTVANGSYCYRCLTRGHPKEKCCATMFCLICESTTHMKGRCPILKKAKSTYALTCGYAVDGLGFYYIPTSVAVRPKEAAKMTLVWVVEGELNAAQVKAELERLVPSKMSWAVEEIEHNKFKMVFPSKGEMKRMIELGLVHTKDRRAMLIIEELDGGSNVKQVMRKVWVQMTRLPSELRGFLTIWVVGTILGVTKDVDMCFTRQFSRVRMRVLVLDPALIPISVDVVIGDNVYELHFKVEPDEMHENPKPLETDDDIDDMDKMEDGEGGNGENGDFMQEDQGSNSSKGSDHHLAAKPIEQQKSYKGKAKVHLDVVISEEEGDVFSQGSADGVIDDMIVEAWSDEELPKESGNVTTVQDTTKQWARTKKDLAAIPEAETPSCKSKRRLETVDENSLDRVEWIKVVGNLDFTLEKGNSNKSTVSFVHFYPMRMS